MLSALVWVGALLPLTGAAVGLLIAYRLRRGSRTVWWLGWGVAVTGVAVTCCLPLQLRNPAPDTLWEGLGLLTTWAGSTYAVGTLHVMLLFGQVLSALLVWSATTRTTNPTSGDDLSKSMSRKILPSIAKNGIIPRRD